MQVADPLARIAALKRSLGAVILAHYYQDDDIQDIADVIGDSLKLAQEARKSDASVIVFCGVHFMAETAKILNPGKTVLMPDSAAGCSLADSCEPRWAFEAWVRRHESLPLVSYINCPAWVKALSTVICTSSNAEKVVSSFPRDQAVLFAPDRHLSRFVAERTGRRLVPWDGVCVVHDIFEEKRILQALRENPGAELLAHPECPVGILAHAHFIGSTTGIIDRATAPDARTNTFIIATEPGVIHEMKKRAPGRVYIPAPPNQTCACSYCPYMRLNTMEKIAECMERMEPRIDVDIELARRARLPLERMLEISRN
ncbi:MAG: quinolinate synthase NadA [Planctomycetes bacterium]|nr:quinolinate synthase NadA [Planctomycetota bacterium]